MTTKELIESSKSAQEIVSEMTVLEMTRAHLDRALRNATHYDAGDHIHFEDGSSLEIDIRRNDYNVYNARSSNAQAYELESVLDNSSHPLPELLSQIKRMVPNAMSLGRTD